MVSLTCLVFILTALTGSLADGTCGPDMVETEYGYSYESICRRSAANIPYRRIPEKLRQGCRCKWGFLYDIDRDACVNSRECGCVTYTGHFYQIGETYLSEDCEVRTTCVDGNALMSQSPVECGPGETCKRVRTGVGKCE